MTLQFEVKERIREMFFYYFKKWDEADAGGSKSNAQHKMDDEIDFESLDSDWNQIELDCFVEFSDEVRERLWEETYKEYEDSKRKEVER